MLNVVNNNNNNDILVVTNPNAKGTYSTGDDNINIQFSIKKDCLKNQKFKVIPPHSTAGGKRQTRRRLIKKGKTRKGKTRK